MSLSSPLKRKGLFERIGDGFVRQWYKDCPHTETLPISVSAWRCQKCGYEGESQVYSNQLQLRKAKEYQAACQHPSTVLHSGATWCTRCGKQWPGLDNPVIDPVISNLASEMSGRLGQTIQSLIASGEQSAQTAQESVVKYYDRAFVKNLQEQRRALPTQPGSIVATFEINQPTPDPTLSTTGAARAQERALALREVQARAQMRQETRRRRAMEEAARAAAAAFDAGVQDEIAPVKLDTDRRLKIVS